MRRLMVVMGVLLLVGSLGALAPPAGAQSSGAYVGDSTTVAPNDPATVSAAELSQDPVTPVTVSSGALPVTGSDVIGLVGIAAFLIAAGATVLVVRRRVRTPALASVA